MFTDIMLSQKEKKTKYGEEGEEKTRDAAEGQPRMSAPTD